MQSNNIIIIFLHLLIIGAPDGPLSVDALCNIWLSSNDVIFPYEKEKDNSLHLGNCRIKISEFIIEFL